MAKPGYTVQPAVAVIGGGIIGLCCAWQLALRGACVTLFESEKLGLTDDAVAPLLHGGMRSLENAELRLAYEIVQERQWWQEHSPELCRETTIAIPIYSDGPRRRWLINGGLYLYESMAVRLNGMGGHHWMGRQKLITAEPALRSQNLQGAYFYREVLMDGPKLTTWVAQQARAAGAQLMANSPIHQIDDDGNVHLNNYRHHFDFIVNTSGTSAAPLLRRSGLHAKKQTQLMRNSYILLDGAHDWTFILQPGNAAHNLYISPWRGRTLVGATCAKHATGQPIEISNQEIDYLLEQFNRHFKRQRRRADIVDTHAQLSSPIRFKSYRTDHTVSGDYLLERQQKLLNVLGGHWTTARTIGRKVATQLLD